MLINCKAENYCTVKENDYYVVYDTRFKQSTFKTFISAVFETFLPDVNSYQIPLAIKIKDNENTEVYISKDLKVEGTEEF